MARQRKLDEIIGSLKDKASMLKVNLSIKRSRSSVQKAVIKATTHAATAPPPPYRLDDVLSLGQNSLPKAQLCIGATMDRLHITHSPYVALKCLLVLHNIITRGSLTLKDNISFYPSTGGPNSLNLSGFNNKSNVETRDLSVWVQWYAGVLEGTLMASRVLGVFLTSLTYKEFYKNKGKLLIMGSYSNSDLIKQMGSLVSLVKEICEAPETLHYQKNDLVHEVMVLVSEDYRLTQYHIMVRLNEFLDRMERLNLEDLSELIFCLNKLEGCKARLLKLFIRRRNDAFWELIALVKTEAEKVKKDQERQSLVAWNGRKGESTRIHERVFEVSPLLKFFAPLNESKVRPGQIILFSNG